MRTSITTFETRSRERFFSNAQQARLHARPGEAAMIDRVVQAVRIGVMCARDGHAALANLRRDQQAA